MSQAAAARPAAASVRQGSGVFAVATDRYKARRYRRYLGRSERARSTSAKLFELCRYQRLALPHSVSGSAEGHIRIGPHTRLVEAQPAPWRTK